MLKQLEKLAAEVDGRYATDQELQFLEDYLDSVDTRISAYEKIREQAESIIFRVEAGKRTLKEDVFRVGERDVTQRSRYDLTGILRCTAGSMLVGDLDRMREGMLIWFVTIAKSFGFQKQAASNYRMLQQVIKIYLTAQEAALIIPYFQLEEAVIGG